MPPTPSMKVQGRQGRHTQINAIYEPLPNQHNGHTCWAARSVAPGYVFHTGKNRWVISKRPDDGARCFAYMEDPSGNTSNPTECSGQWMCCGDDNDWKPDENVKCSAIPSSNDKFVQLRMSCEQELAQMGLLEMKNLKQLWRRLDFNGNNVVSLAEIDKMVVEMVTAGTWPPTMNNKPALMRAYKATTLVAGDGDSWVEKGEFHALLLNIFWFNKLWGVFQMIDTGADRRIDMGEFIGGMRALGLSLNQQEASEEFQRIDPNHGGQVLFVEFCAYIRKRVNPDDNPAFDADVISGTQAGSHMRRSGHHSNPHHATHTHVCAKKCFADFDELEKQIKQMMTDNNKLRELWKRMDFNGNNIVSLAEIDKLVVEKYPLLNHKPALMRAYKATINAPSADGDDWVDKKEFKMLLGNLFYFNKIFWVFDSVDQDKDRRLTYQEFKQAMFACGAKVSESEARSDFQKVDKNGGGIILFDEFCKFFTAKYCPQCMTQFVG
eukprot:gnl/TRDRNA2_/TRDRNA2_86078_c2_seq1.p1 gnl/TRDRNA2_/TRDRNA2_86078_c2~~gnl/TRDRNA2_/TRDRNA2_86078_c2_seq1.p1  ORF type:complete len:493 (-),score=101.48 gnl/TRDRNA2_/TRDRNA2_86078_c2_seq1:163-1641(-)